MQSASKLFVISRFHINSLIQADPDEIQGLFCGWQFVPGPSSLPVSNPVLWIVKFKSCW